MIKRALACAAATAVASLALIGGSSSAQAANGNTWDAHSPAVSGNTWDAMTPAMFGNTWDDAAVAPSGNTWD
ncbi:MAG: hypothetical protein ACRDP1_09470 [Nocardioidaceae bacterium]